MAQRSPRGQQSRHNSSFGGGGTRGSTTTAANTNKDDDITTSSSMLVAGQQNKGILTSEKVAAALSNLGHTPDGHLVYLNAQLSGLALTSIDVLGQKFMNLQSLYLDRNKLTSLEGLKGMKHLAVLSASHNQITAKGVIALIGAGRTDDKGYKGPKRDSANYNPLRRTIQRLILHNNKIEDASCVRGFEYAYEIDLSNNAISGEITDKCISQMGSLGVLRMANNSIKEIDGWAFDGCVALHELDLSNNEISKFDCAIPSHLKSLNLSLNSIMECKAFAALKMLVDLDISANNINELGEVAHLSACTALRNLQLHGNPVMKEASSSSSAAASGEGNRLLSMLMGTANNAATNLTRSGKPVGGGATSDATMSRSTTNAAAADGGDDGGVGAAEAADEEEEHEGAATDEVEDERLQNRLGNFQVDASLLNNNRVNKNSGGGGDTKASRDLASLAARKQQQINHGGGVGGNGGSVPREVVAAPFSEMYLHLSRQKELNMDVANVIRRTAQLLRTTQEHDVAAGRMGESMQFNNATTTATAYNSSTNTRQQGSSSSGGGGSGGGNTNIANISNTLGGQSGASTMLLSPEEEDMLELQQLSVTQQIRLKVLWRLPAVAVLDSIAVTAEELALAQCLAGGTDRKQRQEAKDRAFGPQQPHHRQTAGHSHQEHASTSAIVAGGGSRAIQSLRQR